MLSTSLNQVAFVKTKTLFCLKYFVLVSYTSFYINLRELSLLVTHF
ncbi:hypothetical protein SAMN05421785_1254 [Chryseobacterium gambrini]|uniref:Uncharacterized protein n=1 Tax=Chryseobacterium gambrini TaxID=373672 RepID=A0A1N7R072_9FLAO|nr:hypothetical protein SAMN05421785_1254 [Chryseobacterium gambrini]